MNFNATFAANCRQTCRIGEGMRWLRPGFPLNPLQQPQSLAVIDYITMDKHSMPMEEARAQ